MHTTKRGLSMSIFCVKVKTFAQSRSSRRGHPFRRLHVEGVGGQNSSASRGSVVLSKCCEKFSKFGVLRNQGFSGFTWERPLHWSKQSPQIVHHSLSFAHHGERLDDPATLNHRALRARASSSIGLEYDSIALLSGETQLHHASP